MAPTNVPPELPATAEDIVGSSGFVDVVRKLVICITGAVHESKSVTAANKRLIVAAAEEIRRATRILETTLATLPPVPAPAPPPSTSEGFKREIAACVREELQKFTKQQQHPRTQHTSKGRPSYSQAVAFGAGPSEQADRCSELPVTKPAIIITPKSAKTKQEAIEAWRRSITFRDSGYAPTRIQAVSNNKLRVEFDSRKERDDTLSRLNDATDIRAEPARSIMPMAIIKGISKEVPSEELTNIITRQNRELSELVKGEGDLRVRFLRRNRNPALYNAVIVAQPRIWRKMVQMGRVCIDHQRVHVDEFSPFIQCYKCLNFGHISTKCPSNTLYCAHCAEASHTITDCPNRANPVSKCVTCIRHNDRFNTSESTNHKATSTNCPRMRSMAIKISNRVDYGYN